jgi:hypothetical protein
VANKADSDTPGELVVKRDGEGRIFSHVRQKWLLETPEERVGQEILQQRIIVDAKQLRRVTFRQPIFMYDAEKVGITATGASDENELYPNDRVPTGLGATALEEFNRYLKNPTDFRTRA